MPSLPRHSSLTVEHYTPTHVVEAARATLGAIDLDPASCAIANETVRAARYIALPNDGMAERWRGRVFVNPPGGLAREPWRTTFDTRSSAVSWWRKLLTEVHCGHTQAAVFVGFSVEILQSSQGSDYYRGVLDFPLCVPAKRLHFTGGQPTHANVIAYIGPHADRFREAFAAIGMVKT